MTLQAQEIVQRILYGPEPLTFLELITRPGFIKLMLTIWSPVVITLLIMYIIHIIKKNMETKIEIEDKKSYISQRLKDAV